MTKLFLIRHGEPTYETVTARKFKGQGRDLGCLTPNGILQAKKAAQDERLKDAEIIISSPYTRALQTAAIISKELGIDIIVENDLHEWVPDLSFNYDNDNVSLESGREMIQNKGEYPNGETRKWETLSSVANRSINCLKKYLNYKKVIVVSHAIVMRQIKFKDRLDYCEILEVDFDDNFNWNGWVEK